MKSRRCSYRKRCSGFCSCPDSNWPPRYSYHGNVVSLFACSIIIAYSKIPFFFLPTLHSYCWSVHYHCSATEWHCCSEQKSPLMSYLGDAKSGCDVGFLWSLHKPLFLQNMVTLYFVVILVLRFIWKVTLRCSFCCIVALCQYLTHQFWEKMTYMQFGCILLYVLAKNTYYILPKRIVTWLWNNCLSTGFVLKKKKYRLCIMNLINRIKVQCDRSLCVVIGNDLK